MNTECPICLESLEDSSPHIKIDNDTEQIYHYNCVNQWVNSPYNKDNRCVITDEKIKSYTVYQQDEASTYLLDEKPDMRTPYCGLCCVTLIVHILLLLYITVILNI